MNSKFFRTFVAASAMAIASPAFAEVVVDFNSGITPTTALNGQNASVLPGLTGNWGSTFSNTSWVVDGTDLTDPYALPQTGTPGRILQESSTGTGGGTALANAGLSAPLSGTTYFSFLASTLSGGTQDQRGVAGIAFNPDVSNFSVNEAFNIAVVRGVQVRYRSGSSDLATGLTTAGTNFYVGEIVWSDAGNETLRLWLNPDTSDPGFLESAPLFTNSDGDMGDELTSIGVYTYEDNGILDNVRLSNNLSEVAVVPEPGTMGMLLFAGAAVAVRALRRRRRSRS